MVDTYWTAKQRGKYPPLSSTRRILGDHAVFRGTEGGGGGQSSQT